MSDVYFIRSRRGREINAETMVKLFDVAGLVERFEKNDFVGIKLHFGEQGNKSHIDPGLLRRVVKRFKERKVKPFLFDTNTLYRGKRINAVDHLTLASQHGFGKLGVPLIIADGLRGNEYFEVTINKKHFQQCYIAALCADIDWIISIAHFTGHMLTGFGASIKNLGMGLAARRGKLAQHSDISPYIKGEFCQTCDVCIMNCPAGAITKKEGKSFIDQDKCIGCAQCISVCPYGTVAISWSQDCRTIQEQIVEYAYAAVQNKKVFYCNMCCFITKECDCMNKEPAGFVADLGILVSYDPVAVDKASIDLLNEREGKDVVKKIYPAIDYRHQFSYAEQIGLGSSQYKLIEIT